MEVEALYKKWKSRGVEFFGIAVSTTDAEWKAFVKEKGFTLEGAKNALRTKTEPTANEVLTDKLLSIRGELMSIASSM